MLREVSGFHTIYFSNSAYLNPAEEAREVSAGYFPDILYKLLISGSQEAAIESYNWFLKTAKEAINYSHRSRSRVTKYEREKYRPAIN